MLRRRYRRRWLDGFAAVLRGTRTFELRVPGRPRHLVLAVLGARARRLRWVTFVLALLRRAAFVVSVLGRVAS
ncbi:hypothetical protein NONI108955_06900 [Nocardia ninae]|uniref:Uncharacterized protein n=1 Tax=Nocardia ninae NBRC 108245 TaxID=1210091 RepID=A0A511MPE0_9NOCA|nr:hypothetical protein [Nocardia ninae]GEM42058.1 hypothetical protein NN4_65770 [Nocardia ninae NBRC 108245]